MPSGLCGSLARRRRSPHRRRATSAPSALVAALATVVGAVFLVNSVPVSSASAASPPGPVLGPACPDVMVIAARGSGEQPQPKGPHGSWNNPAAYTFKDTYYGVGAFNYSVYSALETTDSRLRFSLDPVRYPADPALESVTNYPAYEASAADGAYDIVTEIARTRAACGDQIRFVLAGYSQGAWSVHRALYAIAAQDKAILGLISAVYLFGDPEFQPGQVIDRGSQKGLPNSGLATPIDVSHRNVPASLRARTASYCLPRDPICQGVSPVSGLAAGAAYLAYCLAVNWAPGKCPHTSYQTSGATARTASFVRPLLPKTSWWPRLTLTTPRRGTVGVPYSWTATASCSGPCHWSAPASGLPPGLRLSTRGVLSGKPARAGTFAFTITATGQHGRSAAGQVTVTVGTGSPDWVELGANAGHTGLSTSTPALSAATVRKLHRLWSATLTTSSSVFSSSPVVAAGIAYVVVPGASSSVASHLKAFSATTGALLWSKTINYPSMCPYAAQEGMTCEPAVAGDVVLVVGSYVTANSTQWTVQAFNARTGASLWTLKPLNDFLTLATNGNIVYVAGGAGIEAVSAATGKVIWTTVASEAIPSGAPAIADGRLYLITEQLDGSADLNIFNSATGAALTMVPLPTGTSGAPPVADNGRVLLTVEPAGVVPAGPPTGHLIALDGTTGATLWNANLKWASDVIVGRPVSTGSLIVAGDQSGTAAALDPATGRQVWLKNSPNPPYIDPSLDAISGNVMVTGGSATSLGLIDTANGALVGTLAAPSSVYSATAPAIDAGMIYMTQGDHLFAYGAN